MRNFLLVVFVGISFANLFGQVDFKSSYHDTYWYYRYRLLNGFIVVGEGQGKSLPMTTRNVWGYNSPTAKWSDEPMSLASYIGVLATEYRLLKNNQRTEDLERTKTELFYALKAFYRLNVTSVHTVYTGSNSLIRLDEFMLRGDTRSDFFNDPNNKSALNSKNSYFDMDSVKTVESGYQDWQSDPSQKCKIHPSTDHFINVMTGLYLVYKLCDDNDQVKKLDGNAATDHVSGLNKFGEPYTITFSNFKTTAKTLISQMIKGVLKDETFQGQIDLGIENRDFIIKDPNGTPIKPQCGGEDGGILVQYAYPLEVLYEKLNGEHLYSTQKLVKAREIYVAFINLSTEMVSEPTCYHPSKFLIRYLLLKSLAFSNFKDIRCPVFLTTNQNGIPGVFKTEKGIERLAMSQNWQGFYKLLWSVMNNGTSEESLVPERLNETFSTVNGHCHGVRFFPDDPTQAPAPVAGPWNMSERYERPKCEAYEGWHDMNSSPRVYNMKANFYGIEYMLVHNLYYLKSGEYLPLYENMFDRKIDYPITRFTALGVDNETFTYKAFDKINANEKIQNDAKVEFKATNEITLSPGFEVAPGSEFLAKIEYVHNCNNTDGLTHIYTTEGNEVFKRAVEHTIVEDLTPKKGVFKNESDNKVNSTESVSLFPNPSKGRLTLSSAHSLITKVHIYSQSGKLAKVITSKGSNISIDISNLQSGMYFAKMYLENNEVAMKKFILKK